MNLVKKRDGLLQVAGFCPPARILHQNPVSLIKCASGRPAGWMAYICLIICAFIWSSSPAWARVDTRSGEPRLRRLEGQVHAGTFTKSYSRTELNRPDFSPGPRQLQHRLFGEVTDLLNRVRQGLGGAPQRQALESLKTREPEARRWHQSQTLMGASVETVPTNLRGLSSFFTNESQRAAADSVRERVPALSQLTSFNFNFDLEGGGGSSNGSHSPAQGGVRYGLIVRDILPDMGGVKRASTTASPEELAHAGRARVQWGIGPLQETEERPIMNEQPVDVQTRRSFAGILVPSAKFKGSARAESFNLGGSGRGQLPPWRFDLTQEDQLYNLTYRTQKNPQFGNMEHTLNVPLVGGLSVGQKYSESFSRVATTASGVLMDRHLPNVILHYLHLEKRYKAEVQTTVNGNRVGATARSKVRGVTDRPDEASEAYSLTFSKDF